VWFWCGGEGRGGADRNIHQVPSGATIVPGGGACGLLINENVPCTSAVKTHDARQRAQTATSRAIVWQVACKDHVLDA
jgi:hypothetical protein